MLCIQRLVYLLSHLFTSPSDISFRLSEPLNKILGRRGTISFTCWLSVVSYLFQAFSRNWHLMVTSRILLGVGFGLESATIRIYISDCAPTAFRGALVMLRQLFTALGITLGFICAAMLRKVLDDIETNNYAHQHQLLHRVSYIIATTYSGLTPTVSNVQADPMIHIGSSLEIRGRSPSKLVSTSLKFVSN